MGRNTVVFAIVAGIVAVAIVVTGLVILLFGSKPDDCELQQEYGDQLSVQGVVTSQTSSLYSADLTVHDGEMKKLQKDNAITIMEAIAGNVGKEYPGDPDATFKAQVIGIVTTIVESNITNPTGGMGSSIGPFQQQDAWGPASVRHNIEQATGLFLNGGRQGQPGLFDVSGWQTMPIGEAAQAVQRSGPNDYHKFVDEAINIVKAYRGENVEVDSSASAGIDCDEEQEEDLLPKAVQIALGKVGSDYTWAGDDGAGLLSAAAQEAGFPLPTTLEQFIKFRGNDMVSVQTIDGKDITSPSQLQYGDIVLYNPTGGAKATQVGFALDAGGSLNGDVFASFNVRGAGHTAGQKWGWRRRFPRTMASIDRFNPSVLGMQEVHGVQYRAFNRELGKEYDVYPSPSSKIKGNAKQNPIYYRAADYTLLDSGIVPNLRYLGGQLKAPWVKLEKRSTKQVFTVINLHNPYNRSNAKKRADNAHVVKQFMDKLPGLSVAMGDWNNSFKILGSGINPTLHGLKKYNVNCIMTAGGEIRNALDIWKKRYGQCPTRDVQAIDHVFIKGDVQVTKWLLHAKLGSRSYPVNGSDHPMLVVQVGLPGDPQQRAPPTKRYESTLVGYKAGKTDIVDYDVRDIVKVLRPQVTAASSSGACVPYPAAAAGLKPDAKLTLECLHGEFGAIKTFGGVGSRGNVSDHPSGRAIDAMISSAFLNYKSAEAKAYGWRVANWAREHARELGVKYVIYFDRIWSVARNSEGWRPYGHPSGASDDTSSHRDHVHVSVYGNAATGYGGDGGWVLPLSGGYTKTASFNQAGNKWSANHTGQDFAQPVGQPVRAVTSGTVTSVESAGAYGDRIVITTGDGMEFWYCHLSRYAVKDGEAVRTGQHIGDVGATGNVTGPHLHLEVRPHGGKPVDPIRLLRSHGLNP